MSRQAPYYKIDIPQDDPGNEWSAGNYFHKNNFILFNLAVGGNFPGIHNASGITALNDGNGQEASMYVNYVKIYQKGTPDEDLFSIIPGDDQPAGVSSAIADTDSPVISVGEGEAVCEGALLTVYGVAGNTVAVADSRVDLSILPAGIYIISACTGTATATVKIVK